jgi:hypothetical protein
MSEEIDRWVRFMKEHPKGWKKVHSEFIDAQFDKSTKFMNRLALSKGGRDKIISAYHIKNVKGYARLLR